LFPELAAFRRKNCKNLIFGHYNINSLPPKCEQIMDILKNDYIDILGLVETKLDDNFVDAEFQVDNFNMYRLDRNRNGGGILCYVRSSIPHRLRSDIMTTIDAIECLAIEVKVKNEKLFFIFLYKPPSVSNQALKDQIHNVCDKAFNECSTLFFAW